MTDPPRGGNLLPALSAQARACGASSAACPGERRVSLVSTTVSRPETRTRVLENYIDGAWAPSSSQELLDVTNPATGEVIARVPLSTADEVEDAVRAARAAFEDWRLHPVIERARWLFGFRQALPERRDDLARSVTREMGKTLPDAKAEVARMIEMVECA